MTFNEFHPRSTLYHYTTFSGFEGITSSRQLWLSSLLFSNDPRDMAFGLERLKDLVIRVRHEKFPGSIGLYFSILYGRFIAYDIGKRTYTASFTPLQDNLLMFREYTGRGEGVAIGFRPRAIKDMIGRLYRVSYSDVAEADDEIIRRLTDALQPIPDLSNFPDKEEFNADVTVLMMTTVMSLKHSDWSYEQEIRLTLAAEPEEPPIYLAPNFPDNTPYPWRRPLERESRGTIVKYHSMNFGKYGATGYDASRAISDVVLGWNCPLSEEDASSLMKNRGFHDFTIRRSRCPIR